MNSRTAKPQRQVAQRHAFEDLLAKFNARGRILNNLSRRLRRVEADNAQLANSLDVIEQERDDLRAQVVILAKLASPTPMFSNPIHVWEAQELRDRIINQELAKCRD